MHVEVCDHLGVAHERTPAPGPGLVLRQLPVGHTENNERMNAGWINE